MNQEAIVSAKRTRIKVCGLTTLEDALECHALGVDALGLNFWPQSVRRCELTMARSIVQRLGGVLRIVAVVVDASADEVRSILNDTGIEFVQFHGHEPPAVVQRFLPHAYKAFRVHSEEVLADVDTYPGEEVLLDAYVPGVVGGTGRTFNWSIAARLGERRKVWLAGGLGPGNASEAIAAAQPHGVDVASGVESAPGRKDSALLANFVRAVRQADQDPHNVAAL